MADRSSAYRTRRELCFVAILLVALNSLLFGVEAATGVVIRGNLTEHSKFLLINSVTNVVSPLIVAGVLFYFAHPLSRWMAARGNEEKNGKEKGGPGSRNILLKNPTPRELLSIGIILVGLVTFINSTYHAVYSATLHSAVTMDPLPQWKRTLTSEPKAQIIASIVIGFIGIGLIIGYRWIVNLLMHKVDLRSTSSENEQEGDE